MIKQEVAAFEPINPPGVVPPQSPLPDGAWDSHMHVFGPFAFFPVSEAPAYSLPLAPRDANIAMLDRLGISRGMLIQPSPYGTDNRALLDAVAASDGRLLGVASCSSAASAAELADLRSKGIIGLRFVEMTGPSGGRYSGTQGIDTLAALAASMRRAGLHVQLWAELARAVELAERCAADGTILVLDHLAGLSPDDLPGTEHFDRLAAAIAAGRVWVKLTYLRRSRQPGAYNDMHAVVTALACAAPERVIWGSDWPFVRLDRRPSGGDMLDQLRSWLGEEAFKACLVDNPAALLAECERA